MTTKEIKNVNSVAITKTYDLSKPQEVLVMAKLLKNYIVKEKLYSVIKGRNYAQVEGWMFAGFLAGLNVILDDPKDLSNDKEFKWFCSGKMYDKEGKIIASGFGVCSNKEAIKRTFDEYAILSMCQTRTIGKIYRNKLGWIMKLAGYEGTPSEEMHKVDQVPSTPQDAGTQTGEKEVQLGEHVCNKCDAPITKAEAEFSKKRFGKELCREHQKAPNSKK